MTRRASPAAAAPLALLAVAALAAWLLGSPTAVNVTSAAEPARPAAPRRTAPTAAPAAVVPAAASSAYTLIGWNDLGMHCINPSFANMAILPPYNNLQAVLIRRSGEEPQVVTSGVTISYSLDGNTKVAGKTDFWQFAQKLYGKNLQPGIGLAGFGLSGKMKVQSGRYFEATGIPALPYGDNLQWNPFQHATLVAKDSGERTLATASVVVPVSDELSCQKCHDKGGPAAGPAGIDTGNVATNILKLHDLREHTGLMNSQPVNCAKCHSDNALGAAGNPSLRSLSYAMHGKHAGVAPQPACYDCHPGPKTQCNRSAIGPMGPDPLTHAPRCETCHGDLNAMATALAGGRQPWLQEPTCVQCHKDRQFDTGTTLYRKARGHGGLLCIACHNSPHAWWPSLRADDNAVPTKLQGSAKAIGYNACNVCHTDGRKGTMPPHGGDD
jgi:hypothetical protein